jgi:hypothetical protein
MDSECSARPAALLYLATLRKRGPSVMAASWVQRVSGVTGQRVGLPVRGSYDELDVFFGLVRLRPGQGEHQAVGVFGNLVEVRAASTRRRRAATNPTISNARSRAPARSGSSGRPDPVLRRGCVGCLPKRRPPGRCGWGRAGFASGGGLDRRQAPAHGADLGAVAGQVGQVPGDRGRGSRAWVRLVLGAPSGDSRQSTCSPAVCSPPGRPRRTQPSSRVSGTPSSSATGSCPSPSRMTAEAEGRGPLMAWEADGRGACR